MLVYNFFGDKYLMDKILLRLMSSSSKLFTSINGIMYTDGNSSSVTQINSFDDYTNGTLVSYRNDEIKFTSQFAEQSNLRYVDFPELIAVYPRAFIYCSNLQSVNIPKARNIGDYAFSGCFSLQSVNFPNVIHTISSYAFQDCSSLSAVAFENLDLIPELAFAKCTGPLTSMSFPNASFIGRSAF